MKRGSAVGSLLAAAVLAVCFTAPALSQEEKIGIVDMVKVIDQSDPGKKAMKEMADKLKGAKSDLEKRQSKLVKMKDEIEKNAMILTGEELAKQERQYQEDFIDYQRKMEEFQDQLSTKNQEINKAFMSIVEGVVNTIGADGYALILEKTSSGILYNADTVDLTDEVIEQLNNQ